MKKLLLLLLVMIGFIQTVAYSNNSYNSDEWTKVVENNYVNTSGITGTYDRYGFSFLLKSYNKGQYEPVNNHAISYTISRYTIDCDKLSYKIGIMDSYGKNDEFITGDYNKFAQFQPIIPDTAIGTIANKLCKHTNQ